MIRSATAADAQRICDIYNHYVTSTWITFEQQPVAPNDMAQRIETVGAAFPWLVYEQDGDVQGYAYATAWRARSAYRYSVESTVYVAKSQGRRGIGRKLYMHLLSLLRSQGIEVVLGGIALPNTASIALHEQLGFEKVAHFKRVGRKFEQWRDVGYWELLLGAGTEGRPQV